VIVVTQSWYKTIFVFGDFWNIAIFTVGDYRFTIDKPAKLIIAYFISRLLYIIVTYSLEATILNRLNISKKYSSNVTSIIRYIFIMSFFGFCAAILGMTYKNLVIFASALGVGIGFGLQNIVNNFISGVILLFEQPIRVGDIIEVNDYFAKVKHIGIRSTIVESLDNSSIIIPNSEILSNKLTNWTFNNNIIAIVCDVGVSYDSNTQLVANLLDQVAKESPDVLTSPPHQVWFNEFGDSSLNFKLKVWINRPVEKFIIHSRLMHAIFNILNENQIVIPFPQRDLHIKSDETKLI
jgi:small-conductance mechanosensitive channel